MKIVDLRATTVTVPLQAPLHHANGAHWGRFVRTIGRPYMNRGRATESVLGEGDTPLVSLDRLARRWGLGALWAKCEHLNPTGSYKDRIAAAASSGLPCEQALGSGGGHRERCRRAIVRPHGADHRGPSRPSISPAPGELLRQPPHGRNVVADCK